MLKEPEPLRSNRWFRSLSDEELAEYRPRDWPVHNYGRNAISHTREVKRRIAVKASSSKDGTAHE